MPRKDINQIAFDVVRQATGEVVKEPESERTKASRKGGQVGGKSRMESLTKEQRSELSRKAAAARWQQTAPTVKTGAVRRGLVKKQR